MVHRLVVQLYLSLSEFLCVHPIHQNAMTNKLMYTLEKKEIIVCQYN